MVRERGCECKDRGGINENGLFSRCRWYARTLRRVAGPRSQSELGVGVEECPAGRRRRGRGALSISNGQRLSELLQTNIDTGLGWTRTVQAVD